MAPLSTKKCQNLTDTIKNSRLTIKKKTKMTKHLYLNLVSSLVTWEELLKLERMNITWSWSTITIQLHIPNGSTLECRTSRNSLLTSSILSIWSSPKVLITKVWNHSFTLKRKLSKMMELEMVGIVTEPTFVTSQIHSRRRVEASTTLLPSRSNSCTMKTRSTPHIAILTRILTVQNFW